MAAFQTATGGAVVSVVGTNQPPSEPVDLHDGAPFAAAADFRGLVGVFIGVLLSRGPHRTTADHPPSSQ